MFRLLLVLLTIVPFITSAQGSYGLNNPVAFTSITAILAAVLRIVMVVAIPIVVLFLILAGFKYVTARGNPEQISEANKALLYGVIGGVIIVGAVAILTMITSLVGEFDS